MVGGRKLAGVGKGDTGEAGEAEQADPTGWCVEGSRVMDERAGDGVRSGVRRGRYRSRRLLSRRWIWAGKRRDERRHIRRRATRHGAPQDDLSMHRHPAPSRAHMPLHVAFVHPDLGIGK